MDVAEHQDWRDNILVLVERRNLRTHKSIPDNKSGKKIGETKVIKLKIDDTPEDAYFNSLKELAEFLGVNRSTLDTAKHRYSDRPNHFWINGYPITIIEPCMQTKRAKYLREYHKKKKDNK